MQIIRWTHCMDEKFLKIFIYTLNKEVSEITILFILWKYCQKKQLTKIQYDVKYLIPLAFHGSLLYEEIFKSL